jgi:pimeloyl-ACP methyl ester carboxylesterase
MLGVGVALALAGAVYAAPAGAAESVLAFTPCPIEVDEGAIPVECAALEVPLDYDVPGGDTVTLAVFKLATADPALKKGHLLMNPGGPGGATKDFLAGIAGGVTPEVAATYDLVAFDPRGIGESEGLSCGLDQDLVAELDDPIGNQRAYADALAAECLAEGGPLVATMTAVNAARDMESVRLALGDPKLTYLGFSYGATIGSAYLDLFPGNAGRVVLDGATNPNKSYRGWVRDQVVAFEASLVRFAGWCDADADCGFGTVSTLEVWEYLSWRAGETGLPVAEGPPLTRRELETATIAASYFPDDFMPRFGAGLRAALNGDASFLRRLSGALSGGFASGTYYAGVCGDDPTRSSADWEYLVEIAGVIGEAPHLFWALREIVTCGAFPVSTTPLPVVSVGPSETVPTVVVGNVFDAATPYSGSVAMSEAISGSTLVTFDGGGHTIVFQGVACIDGAITAYLVDGVQPAAGLRCAPPEA